MKKVKKQLAANAKNILPDKRVKEDLITEISGDEQLAYAGGGMQVKRNNKLIFAIIASIVAVIIVLCVTLPLIFSGNTTIITPSIPISTITTDEFYAYGAASAGSILAAREADNSTAMTAKATAKTKTASSLTSGQQQAVDLVNEYIYYVEELLGNSSVTYTTGTYDGDLSQNYQYSMTISYSDLLGNSVSYTMYYNETQTGTKTDKDEVETYYQISGTLIVNDEEYAVQGGKTEESEAGETSNEIWFKAYTDDNSYILIKQEYEEETEDGQLETEQTKEIYFYANGILTESVVAETESEDGETELELEITKDGIKSTIEFSYQTKSGQIVLDVEAKIGNTKYTFKIYVESDCYRYVFGSTEYSYERNLITKQGV